MNIFFKACALAGLVSALSTPALANDFGCGFTGYGSGNGFGSARGQGVVCTAVQGYQGYQGYQSTPGYFVAPPQYPGTYLQRGPNIVQNYYIPRMVQVYRPVYQTVPQAVVRRAQSLPTRPTTTLQAPLPSQSITCNKLPGNYRTVSQPNLTSDGKICYGDSTSCSDAGRAISRSIGTISSQCY